MLAVTLILVVIRLESLRRHGVEGLPSVGTWIHKERDI